MGEEIDLERRLITLQAKREGTLRHVLALDIDPQTESSALVKRVFEREFSHKQLTSTLLWERAKQIDDELRTKGIKSELKRFGWPRTDSERWTVTAFLKNAQERESLPEEFIVASGAVYAPRTNPFLRRSNPKIARIEEHLQGLGFEAVDMWERTKRQYRIVRSLRGEYRIEVAPMREGAFKEFAEQVIADPLLRRYFQIWEYRTEPFKKKEEAKEFFKKTKTELNQERWFKHHFAVVPTNVSNGFSTEQLWQVRGHTASAPTDPDNPLLAYGFNPQAKLNCHKSYRDPSQQDEQRRHTEIDFPALRRINREPLSASDLEELVRVLPRHMAAIDLEVTGYVKEKWAPRPSGMIVHAVLRSLDEKIIFAVNEFAPHQDEVYGYRIVRCSDELDLVAKLNEASSKYAFLSCHNGRGYDQAHLSKFNSRWTRKKVEEKTRSTIKKIKDKETREGPTATYTIKRDIQETADYINRLLKGVKQKPWTCDSLIDTLLFFRKRPHLFTGLGLEGITGESKEEDYARLEHNFRTKTVEGLLENAQYTAADGEKTWKALMMALPVLVAESYASGRPLPAVAASAPYHNMNEIKEKNAIKGGRHYRSNLFSRTPKAKLEKEEKESAKSLSAFKWPKRRSGMFEGSLWHNPLVARTFRPELSQRPELVMLGNLSQGTAYQKAVAIHTAENYFSPALRFIRETLAYMNKTIYHNVSREEFFNAACERFNIENLPNVRFAREHQVDLDFNIIDIYQRLSRSARKLAMLQGSTIKTGVGPFLVGELPQSLGYFKLGEGRMAVFNDKMIAELRTPNGGLETISWGVKIPKKDAQARADIKSFLRGESELSYEPTEPRTQKLYTTLNSLSKGSVDGLFSTENIRLQTH